LISCKTIGTACPAPLRGMPNGGGVWLPAGGKLFREDQQEQELQ